MHTASIILSASSVDASTALWVNATIMAALITAAVTIASWILTRWWEVRIRRLEQKMKYRERQIEEFYGPLYNVMHQVFAAEEVQDSFLKADPAKEQDIRDYFQTHYFRPLHSEMLRILKERLHLVEGDEVPSSYEEYLRHVCDDRSRGELKIYPPENREWP